MEERGWSGAETARKVRDQLGDSATFTSANIAHYRSGRSRPRPQYLAALSVAFGKPEEYFLGGFKIDVPRMATPRMGIHWKLSWPSTSRTGASTHGFRSTNRFPGPLP